MGILDNIFGGKPKLGKGDNPFENGLKETKETIKDIVGDFRKELELTGSDEIETPEINLSEVGKKEKEEYNDLRRNLVKDGDD
jgi:hypothetical protein